KLLHRVINAIIWHPARISIKLVSGQWNVFNQLIVLTTERLARSVSIVYPDFISIGNVDGLARVAAEAGDGVDAFPGAQVNDLYGSLVFSWNKQTLAVDVHGHVIEVAFDIGQNNRLDQMHRRGILSPRASSDTHAKKTEDRSVPIHSFSSSGDVGFFTPIKKTLDCYASLGAESITPWCGEDDGDVGRT